MGEVNLIIQGKSYPIACDAGQEGRVAALGRYIDRQISDIARTGAATEESHLLVLTSLILADRVDEMQSALDNVPEPASIDIPEALPERVSEEDEREIVAAINALASRIDSVAERLGRV